MSKINIVQIQAAIGIPLTAEFITKTLGIGPNPELTVKRAVFWDRDKYGVIVGRLQNFLNSKGAIDPTTFSPDRPKKTDDAAPAAKGDDGAGFSFGDDQGAEKPAGDGFSFGDDPAPAAAADDTGFDFGGDEPATEDAGFFS